MSTIVKYLILWTLVNLIAVMFIIMTPDAKSHTAASGWQYPSECCGGNDCTELKEDEVEQFKNGYYFRFPWKFSDGATHMVEGFKSHEQTKPSGDAKFHACVNEGALPGQQIRCAFVPLTAWEMPRHMFAVKGRLSTWQKQN